MKKLIIPLVLLLVFLCGCEGSLPEINVEEILRSVVESIDWEELKGYVEQGADAVLEKFPALKTLTDHKKMQELLKDKGLDLMRQYLESTDPAVQENAEKLGAIIKILSPQLSDEVDAVLGE